MRRPQSEVGQSAITRIVDRALLPDDLREEWPGDVGALTLVRAVAIVNAIRAGNFHGVAAHLAGTTAATLQKWMEDTREPYATFQTWVEAADAFGELHALAGVRASADPKVALAFLGRRFPSRWGRRAQKDQAMFGALQQAADSGQRAAARERMKRVRPWQFRKSVQAKARRAAEQDDVRP